MDSSIPSYDDERPRFDLSKSHSLELAYQESLRKSDLIIKDEGARRLRLRILLLEDENDELHEQLAIVDDRIDELEQDCAELQRQVEQAEAESHRYEAELRAQARELNNRKAELSSLNGLSVDSTKLLTEKLSLSRELATLKPELEHLRSQAAYQRTVLAEKLALQRQVSTLEVELETEKRASKRAGHKDKESMNEDELQRQIDELRKELSREKREKEKAQTAGEKESSEWETRKAVLEGKVELLRTKLRDSKDHVKELQAELAQAHAAATRMSVTSTNVEVLTETGRKRTALQMSTDAAIGTPDGVAVRGKRPAAKRGKADQTLLGEKSMFSITPYLNRTISVAPETPQRGLEPEANDVQDTESNGMIPIKKPELLTVGKETLDCENDMAHLAVRKPKNRKKAVEKNILKDAKNAVTNAKAPSKKTAMVSMLQKVVEEVDENMEPAPKATAMASIKPSLHIQPTAIEGLEPKKKKRKLLGAVKTLFDEEDGEATKRPAKIMIGSTRVLGRGGLKASKDGVQGGLAGTVGGFGAFSPLKKDKRGAQASFLV